MNLTKFNLLLSSIFIIVLYFNVAFYNDWLHGKIWAPGNNVFDQAQTIDLEHRYQYRFGNTYVVYKDIQRALNGHKGATVLLPNNDYLRSIKITDVSIDEPAVFYYFTGINAVWASSPGVEKANWALLASKKLGLRLMEIKSKPQLDSVIAAYKPFEN